jgi:hypothetical protein
MLFLENAICGIGPIIPNNLKEKIRFVANYSLEKREAELFTLALTALNKQFMMENKQDIMRVICIITSDGTYTMKMDKSQLGSQHAVCLYAVEKWRKQKYGDYQMLTIMLEELCHHFWAIEDETKVQYKVLEIIKIIDPNITIEQLYKL